MSAWEAYLRLGQYEGERAIAHAAIYLCVAPKSNAVDAAWKAAKDFVAAHPDLEPPLYIRNAPTQLMKELGYNRGYRYAHDEPHGYPAGREHNCWPDGLPEQAFYRPREQGQEKRFAELMEWRAALDRQAPRPK
jgi:putative ATPase